MIWSILKTLFDVIKPFKYIVIDVLSIKFQFILGLNKYCCQ
eukprot:UN08944